MFLHCLTSLLYTEIIVTTIFPDHCQFSHIGFYNLIQSFSHIFKITENEGLHDSWVNRQVQSIFCNSAYATNFAFMSSRLKH
jgi:hypothetical protein